MKALFKSAAGPGLVLTNRPEPEPGFGEVKIRVHTTGLCGTDLHILHWDAWAAATITAPLIPGHEFYGEVTAIGPNVTTVQPGDRVSGEGHVVCGLCRNCRAGRRHLCINTQSVGVQRDGAFAEFVVIPETNVWVHRDSSRPASNHVRSNRPASNQPGQGAVTTKTPTAPPCPQISAELGAIFDPLGNAVHTALSFPVVSEDVLITGAGPIGLMAAAVARHAGARFIVITDVCKERLQLAETMGVNLAVNVADQRIGDVQRALGMREGFDIGLEMSGHPTALPEMLDNMNHGGRIAMLGLPHGEIGIDFSRVVTHMLTLKGIYGREMYETWYSMMAMLESDAIARQRIESVITDVIPAQEWERGFDLASQGRCGKILLDWRTI